MIFKICTIEKFGNSPDKKSTQAKDHWTPSGTILNHKKLQSSCKAPEKSNNKNKNLLAFKYVQKENIINYKTQIYWLKKIKYGYYILKSDRFWPKSIILIGYCCIQYIFVNCQVLKTSQIVTFKENFHERNHLNLYIVDFEELTIITGDIFLIIYWNFIF